MIARFNEKFKDEVDLWAEEHAAERKISHYHSFKETSENCSICKFESDKKQHGQEAAYNK